MFKCTPTLALKWPFIRQAKVQPGGLLHYPQYSHFKANNKGSIKHFTQECKL